MFYQCQNEVSGLLLRKPSGSGLKCTGKIKHPSCFVWLPPDHLTFVELLFLKNCLPQQPAAAAPAAVRSCFASCGLVGHSDPASSPGCSCHTQQRSPARRACSPAGRVWSSLSRPAPALVEDLKTKFIDYMKYLQMLVDFVVNIESWQKCCLFRSFCLFAWSLTCREFAWFWRLLAVVKQQGAQSHAWASSNQQVAPCTMLSNSWRQAGIWQEE